MKARIAVCVHGGVGTGRYAQGFPMLVKLLSALSKDVSITVFSQCRAEENFVQEGIHFFSPLTGRWAWLRWLKLMRAMVLHHRRDAFTHVVAFWGFPAGFVATVVGKWLRIDTTICLMGGDATGIKSIPFGVLHRPFHRPLALWAYRNADRLMTLTHFQADHLKKFGLARKVLVLPWGPVEELFEISRKAPSDTLHCLHVGHLTPVKDQFTLLRAFKELLSQIPAELRIAGGDNMNGRVQAFCAELGISKHVTFLDLVRFEEIPSHYQWADCLIHTSLYEGQAMVITEAAAAGLFVAATRVGIMYDAGEYLGVTAEPGDFHSLARQILEYRRNSPEWDRVVAQARAWCRKNSFEATVSGFRNAFGLPPDRDKSATGESIP